MYAMLEISSYWGHIKMVVKWNLNAKFVLFDWLRTIVTDHVVVWHVMVWERQSSLTIGGTACVLDVWRIAKFNEFFVVDMFQILNLTFYRRMRRHFRVSEISVSFQFFKIVFHRTFRHGWRSWIDHTKLACRSLVDLKHTSFSLNIWHAGLMLTMVGSLFRSLWWWIDTNIQGIHSA
jgi:hypothetical protein